MVTAIYNENKTKGGVVLDKYMFDRKIIDISTDLCNDMDTHSSMDSFKGQWIRRIDEDNRVNMSAYSMISHVGTHVDAPFHFVKEGKKLDEMPLNKLMGRAQIIEVPYPETVTSQFLRNEYLNECRIILFKFGEKRLDRIHDYFDESAVKFLIQNNVDAIGTDNITIDSRNTKYKIHQLIMPKDIMIIPALKLNGVGEGVYDFVCLPLLIKGSEGAPARALLFVD